MTLPKDSSLTELEDFLATFRRAVLLFSGGLDSSLLLALGARVLGSGLTALTFVGPHTAPGELAGAWELSRRFRVNVRIKEIDPFELPDFQKNTVLRCYACKRAIIQRGWEVAGTVGAHAMWDGTNRDDLMDFRPGIKAARELEVRSPLLELGLGKDAIKRMSRELGLPVDRPSQSCLATRFPFNTEITREALARVGQTEAWLKARGFSHVRLRVRGEQTRLELKVEEWPRFLDPKIHKHFQALLALLGWRGLELASGGE